MLNIRRLSTLQIQVMRWQQRYQPEKSAITPRIGELYFRAQLGSTTEKISALIPVEQWCCHRWPELNTCAWQALDTHSLVSVFMNKNEGCTFFANEFRVDSVEIVEGGVINRPWLTVMEPLLGTVLLASPIRQLEAAPARVNIGSNVTQQLDWVLGYSYISAGLLQTLALRDVLCIQQLQLQLTIAGRAIARFQKQQEGVFVVEENIDYASGEEDTLPRLDDVLPENSPRPFNMDDVTVKLTFVLGQSEIPLTELALIQPGSVYELGADKDREVKVYANKQLIAEGELIYIGDDNELGLEVTKLACQGQVGS
ncbi:type III secretion apparatus protein [Yersinia massiliensis]|uniref:FliM/FliN family flagellar motor switch protein n=1 Tax=Yersinia massiliensis TaxID=419257 RepID=UPI0005E288DE|nr:FliM/FliN family flagellar motor switch protein [Yersinia massiliensis]CNH38659.1 type III secretion apparatus protein [Yersinia massiliensis]